MKEQEEQSKKYCVPGCVIERHEKMERREGMEWHEEMKGPVEEVEVLTKLKESFEQEFDFIQVFGTKMFFFFYNLTVLSV